MNKSWNLQKNTLFPVVDYSELVNNSDSYKVLIDYLKIAFSKQSVFVESYLKLLVSENSDYSNYTFKWYVLSISRFNWKTGPGLTFYVSYNSIPVELCTICRIDKAIADGGSWYKTLYTCEFKGQYFRLETIGFFDSWFWKDFVSLVFNNENGRITRLDRTVDFFQKEEDKNKKLYIVSPLQFFTKSGIRSNSSIRSLQNWKALKVSANWWTHLEKVDYWNWYYWSRKGKRVYFRMYDKLKDLNQSTWKGKELLYIDYLKHKKVIRVEFECLYKFCYWFTIKSIDLLLEKCDAVFHISSSEWKGKTCYEYKASDNVIDFSSKHTDFVARYFENFGQHWYTIFENNINPFVLLNDQIIKRTESQFIPYAKNKIKDFLREATDSIDSE